MCERGGCGLLRTSSYYLCVFMYIGCSLAMDDDGRSVETKPTRMGNSKALGTCTLDQNNNEVSKPCSIIYTYGNVPSSLARLIERLGKPAGSPQSPLFIHASLISFPPDKKKREKSRVNHIIMPPPCRKKEMRKKQTADQLSPTPSLASFPMFVIADDEEECREERKPSLSTVRGKENERTGKEKGWGGYL
jgi:hypothetical protein